MEMREKTYRSLAAIVALAAMMLVSAGCGSLRSGSGEGGAWRFVVLGDSRGNDDGVNLPVLQELAHAVARERPAFVLFSGDLVIGGAGTNAVERQLLLWRRVFDEPLQAAGIPVYAVRGNHDVAGSQDEALTMWNRVFSGRFVMPWNGPTNQTGVTYWFQYRNALFVNLDDYVDPKGVDAAWAARQFAEHPATHVFMQAHPSAYSLDPGHSQTLDRWPETRDALVTSFMAAGGVAYFCGHDHVYDHARIRVDGKDLHQFVAGTAGAPLLKAGGAYRDARATNVANASCFGYLVADVRGREVSLVMKRLGADGTSAIVDRFSYTASPRIGAPLARPATAAPSGAP